MSQAGVIVVPAAVAVLSLAISLDLAATDLRNALQRRRRLAVGVAAQMLVLPAVALLLGLLIPDKAVVAALLLVALVPSGPTSNYLAAVAHGDVAFAVLLTIIGTLLSVAVLPLAFPVLLELTGYAAVGTIPPVLKLLQNLVLVVLLPLVLGMALARRFPAQVARLRPAIRRTAAVVFAVLILGAIAAEWRSIAGIFLRSAHWVLLANLGAIGLALAVGRVGGLAPPQTITLGLKAGVQNVSVAIAIAIALMERLDVAAIAALYGIFQLLTATSLALARKQRPPALTASP
jgi:BASS family bile acid:Na+ symporter